ncbi:glutaminase [Microbacterium schleiferi]|uniref:Glutaminase n=1 Tax=Microbacterium schleiferi TaxID=69362 RepID=A0A7S8MZ27_9MICO|nr:glutaminase [Microbacterium schleiferi]
MTELLAGARAELADTPRELLGEVVTPRMLGIPRSPRVALRDEVWHLGVLLLGAEDLYATGEVVRSREPARRGYTAESQRARAGLAEAAFRGGILPGTAVHLGWRRLDVSTLDEPASADLPLAVIDGQLRVRWSAAGGFTDADSYVRERVELLRHPPQGAT